MGVGKSTLTKLLARELRCVSIFEDPKNNPFLADFYKDMRRWAFHSQINCLVEKASQLTKIKTSQKKYVQDTPIYQDVFSYAKANYILKNMNKHEWNLYYQTFRLLEKQIPQPDIIIYLKASADEIYERIEKRNRTYEIISQKKSLINYLKLLNKLNNNWIKRVSYKIKVIIVDTKKEKYLTNKNDLMSIVKRIRQKS